MSRTHRDRLAFCRAAARPPIGGVLERTFQELRLPAGAVGRHHQPPRHGVGGLHAEILPHDLDQEVDAGGASRRGEDAPVRAVERGVVHRDRRKPCSQRLRIAPVRRRRAAVQEARRRQNERARTDGRQPRTPVVARRRRSTRSTGTGSFAPFQPGTTMMSAWSRRSMPCSGVTTSPPWARSGPSSTAQLAKRYQPSPISGRARPKTSATIPNSKVQRPS